MIVSQKTHYALRAMFELALRSGQGPRKTGDIARAQQIPTRFLEVIMGEFRQAGLVESRRGARGGYRLTRAPGEVVVGEILRLMEGPIGPVACADEQSTNACGLDGECIYKPMWTRVHDAVSSVVDETSLADLLEEQRRQAEQYVPDFSILRSIAVNATATDFLTLVDDTADLSLDHDLRRYDDVRQLIASARNPTPMVRLNKVVPGVDAFSMFLKLEWMNPFGSIKDRTALYLLEGMERRGELDGKHIVEPSSGNTGIALSAIAALMGKKIIVTVPDEVPEEKKVLLRMLGAEVWETPDDMCPINHPKDGAIALAHSLADGKDGHLYAMPNQYANPDNVRAHYETTGPEIWKQTEGRVRTFIAGYGTCGTLTGTARYLKEMDPTIQVVAMEPQKGHRIPGLKNLQEAKTPEILEPELIDRVIQVPDEPAYAMTKRLFREEGLMVGPSTGAIVYAARLLAEEGTTGVTVGVSPDGGQKYTSFFADILGEEGKPQI